MFFSRAWLPDEDGHVYVAYWCLNTKKFPQNTPHWSWDASHLPCVIWLAHLLICLKAAPAEFAASFLKHPENPEPAVLATVLPSLTRTFCEWRRVFRVCSRCFWHFRNTAGKPGTVLDTNAHHEHNAQLQSCMAAQNRKQPGCEGTGLACV